MWGDHCVGKGSIAFADGMLAAAGPDGCREFESFVQPQRGTEPARAHPVVFGGRLWVQDDDLLPCFDVGRRER